MGHHPNSPAPSAHSCFTLLSSTYWEPKDTPAQMSSCTQSSMSESVSQGSQPPPWAIHSQCNTYWPCSRMTFWNFMHFPMKLSTAFAARISVRLSWHQRCCETKVITMRSLHSWFNQRPELRTGPYLMYVPPFLVINPGCFIAALGDLHNSHRSDVTLLCQISK